MKSELLTTKQPIGKQPKVSCQKPATNSQAARSQLPKAFIY
jgi:hypothetical protein